MIGLYGEILSIEPDVIDGFRVPAGIALSLTGQAPELIAFEADVMQVPAGETLSLTGNHPILLVRGAEVMTVPVGETLSLSGNAPILTPDADTMTVPAGETMSLSGTAPILVSEPDTMTVPAGDTLSLTGNAPTLGATAVAVQGFEAFPNTGYIDLFLPFGKCSLFCTLPNPSCRKRRCARPLLPLGTGPRPNACPPCCP